MMDEAFLVAPASSGSFLVRRRQKMIFKNGDIELKNTDFLKIFLFFPNSAINPAAEFVSKNKAKESLLQSRFSENLIDGLGVGEVFSHRCLTIFG